MSAPPERGSSSRSGSEMSKGRERIIVDECRQQLPKRPKLSRGGCLAGGVSIDLYQCQFKGAAISDGQLGHFFQTTSMARLVHNPADGISLKGNIKGSECKFWSHKSDSQKEIEEMVSRSLKLKHHAVLKPLLCNPNEDESGLISACSVYDETFTEWIGKQQVKPKDDYLSDEEKDIIISLWNAVEEMWEKGYTSDAISQPSSYVMLSQRIKILPYIIRNKQEGDTKMALRTRFALFLRVNLAPRWNNNEFDEFINLIENENASFELILGHPVLLSPVKRQAMYRPFCSSKMTSKMIGIMHRKITETFDWRKVSHKVLASILSKNQHISPDFGGACHLCRIASCHYTQHMKDADKRWREDWKDDTVDKCLKTNLPLVLCRRYALTCDPEFKAASEEAQQAKNKQI